MWIRRTAVCVLFLSFVTACGGGGDRQNLTGPSEPSPDPQASSITITPSSATLDALEDTASFSATVRDQNGTTMSGVLVSWASTNADVATVNNSGEVIAEANGTADIIAQAEGLADTVTVTVDQQASEVAVSPSTDTIQAGETVQLSAEAKDENGHPVSGAEVEWSSADTTVATVDAAGVVSGRKTGEAEILAEANAQTDTAVVVVTDPPGNQAPSALITDPNQGESFDFGVAVTFRGSGDDNEDGELSGNNLEWQSDLDGALGTGTEISESTLSSGNHEITLTATDSKGMTGADTIAITVREPANLVLLALPVIRRGVLTSEQPTASGVVVNAGESAAGGFHWDLTLNGNLVTRGAVSGLAPGDVLEVPTQTLNQLSAGAHRVDLVIDVLDEIPESNESDNSGAQRLVSYPAGFEIELDFLSSVSNEIQQAFSDAADRWAQVILSDLPDIGFSSPQSLEFCAEGAGNRSETIDDILIFVTVDSIDGPGNLLGQARPCAWRQDPSTGGPLTVAVGEMTFDEDDLEQSAQDGKLNDLILHEMGHALGSGVFWDPHGLLFDADTSDPIYLGAAGLQGFFEVGGDGYDGRPVPVENLGEAGTKNVHWRESVFDTELMTGFINSDSNPMSVVTVQSLGDQYYAVDTGAADSYTLPTGAALRMGEPDGVYLGDDISEGPMRALTTDGRLFEPQVEYGGPLWSPLSSQLPRRLESSQGSQ